MPSYEQTIYESLDILNNQNVDPTTSVSNIDDPVITKAKLQEECQNDEPYQLFFFFLFLIGIHSMQG